MGLIQRRTGNLNDGQTAHESKTNIEITCSDSVRQSDFFIIVMVSTIFFVAFLELEYMRSGSVQTT